jgi:hypothetical protein
MIDVCLLAIGFSFFLYFLSFCYEEDEILHPYYMYVKNNYEGTNIGKILGLCIICQGFWLSLFFYISLGLPFIYIFPFIGFSVGGLLLLKRIEYYIYK